MKNNVDGFFSFCQNLSEIVSSSSCSCMQLSTVPVCTSASEFSAAADVLFSDPIMSVARSSQAAPVGKHMKRSLVVAIASDSERDTLGGLLMDIAALQSDAKFCSYISGVDVIILENGPRSGSVTADSTNSVLARVILNISRSRGLRCSLITLEQQMDDMTSGLLPKSSTSLLSTRQPIVDTRTSIQIYARLFAMQLMHDSHIPGNRQQCFLILFVTYDFNVVSNDFF